MPLPNLTLVTVDNCFSLITEYIKTNEIIINEYEDATETVLRMIREGYCINFDKNLLRGMLEDIVYMCNPSDEKNRVRVANMLEESEEEDSDDDEDESPEQMAQMMQMLMGGGAKPQAQSKPVEAEVNKEVEEVEEVEKVSEEPSVETSEEPQAE